MKIETKKTYTFEAGDVIRMHGFFIVGVRTNGFSRDAKCWTHTAEGDFPELPVKLSDEEVEKLLEKGDWHYMGNTSDKD